MTDAQTSQDSTEKLGQLLPHGCTTAGLIDADALERLNTSWAELGDLGFEVEVRADQIQIRNRTRGFESVIHLSREDDLGELRTLFLALRAVFGRRRERLLPWLFLPGREVTAPYEHLRHITAICQQVRQAAARA